MKKIMLMIIISMFMLHCQSNVFDWMHKDGSATGEELVIEAEAYLNAGENSKALELYEKAIPTVDGELKAKAIIGAMSAKYNLVFGEDGLFFLEAGLSLAKMGDSKEGSTKITELLSVNVWAGISSAYQYCTSKGYFSTLANMSVETVLERKKIMPMKMNGAFLSLLGGMAKIIATLNDLANIDDIDFSKIEKEDAEAMIGAIVAGIGINSNDFNISGDVGTNTGVTYEFTKWPYDKSDDNADYKNKDKSKWTSVKNASTNNHPWDDTLKCSEGTKGTNIHAIFTDKTETDTDNEEICKKGTKFIFYSNSKDDSDFLNDIMMANANGGDGMNEFQKQMFGALSGMLYQ